MKPADYARLLLLAAIWGGAFVLLRVATPALGLAWTVDIRVLVGGPALTATFLIPAFGVLWGRLFLGEALPAGMLAAGLLIVAGTMLVTRG